MSRKKPGSWTGMRVFALALPLAASGSARAQEVRGILRIDNRSENVVTVSAENLSFLGQPNWEEVATIPPNNRIELPAVPHGKKFKVAVAGQQAGTIAVRFSSSYQATYKCTVHGGKQPQVKCP